MTKLRRDIDINRYRVLIADNEVQPHEFLRARFEESSLNDKLDLYHARTEDQALDLCRNHYMDLILLDLSFRKADELTTGRAVLEGLAEWGCSADVILMTGVTMGGDAAPRLIQSITRNTRPRVIELVRKDALEEVARMVAQLLDSFSAIKVEISDLSVAASAVASRSKRYPTKAAPREAQTELVIELDRLLRDLFGRVDGFARSTSVAVRLAPLANVGLSSAATLHAKVSLGFGNAVQTSPGNDCVLKIGPIDDMREEFARYEEFVRYGVRLDQRVELLAFAFRDSIGGIVYSFAGGAHGQALMSLDELLRANEGAASGVLSSLFESVSWYTVSTGKGRVRKYIEPSSSTRLEKCLDRNIRSLNNIGFMVAAMPGSYGADATFHVAGGPNLTLPGENYLGEGWSLTEYPWCLVHGDMHGGNVLAELSLSLPSETSLSLSSEAQSHLTSEDVGRTCLIDYRNSGPGPRCIDAAALEASIRIADAERISEESNDVMTEANDAAVQAGLITACRRFDAELQFYRQLWAGRRPPSAVWARLSSNVVKGLRNSFAVEVSLQEYLQTSMLYTIRQLNYDLEPIARVRINTWLAAQYFLLKQLADKESGKV